MTVHQSEPARDLPDWHSTFTANADTATSTVYARGALDLLTLELLRGTVEVLIRSGHVDVTLDLSELTSVDHAGLLLLGGLRHDLDYRGGRLRIVNAHGSVHDAVLGAHLPLDEA